MKLEKNYNPSNIEEKWYKKWLEKGFFNSKPDPKRESYSIVIPPPNVTGVLHMGHMLNNTIQDVLVRLARMKGKNACWLPGTDHASIATESKVVAMLKERGINKADISREEFLEYAWEWREKHGGIILEQLKKLGASCDWQRTKFTMDDDMSESVIKVFIDLSNKGYIYRGIRMINWDPLARTAVSDEEVIHKEKEGKLYFVRYKIEGSDDWLTIATTRPETILGDTGVCVHPEDERYQHLKDKKIIIPLVDRPVPLIFDEYVDREFGTGALKITPAHDINDYEIGQKHNLKSIDIFNDDGTLSENAKLFVGVDRFEARKLAVERLEKDGNLVKIEDYTHSVGYSERTNCVIEPKISTQWFLKMDQLSKPALKHVMNDDIKFHPAKFKNMYKHWMENVKDWCISRQLWWGHRIPAYYLPNGDYVIAKDSEEALKLAIEKSGDSSLKSGDLKQDEDVLDTWFSSWLWPISTFDGIRHPDNEDIKYYYPTNDLVTAPEIIFFWVARMIISGYEYRGDKPFENVYFTGIVRDQQRRKMSKSLGNSPEPLELIKKYGADGVRVGMLLSSPAGNDLLFDEALCEQGRNFNNKIWNATRLILGWEIDENIPQPEHSKVAIEWFNSKLNYTLNETNDNYEKYRISDVLMSLYRLVWEDFCSWFLEIIKPSSDKLIDKETYKQTIKYFKTILKLLHPYIPFITEEIWDITKDKNDENFIIIASYPKVVSYDNFPLIWFDNNAEIVTHIRDFRKQNNIPNNKALNLFIKASSNYNEEYNSILMKLCNLDKVASTNEKLENSYSFFVKAIEYFIPVDEKIDVNSAIKKIKGDLEYSKGFLQSVMKKLDNENFIKNAPQKVIDIEKKKKADAEAKIKVLMEKLESLKKS